MHQIKIEKFEGPLDLLLQLIEQQQLDITQVALSQVTDQYLEYLRGLEEQSPGELADFLVVAAKLLVLKSKALLPYLTWEEEEGEDLETQLRMYKTFLEASRAIDGLIRQKRFTFFRERPFLSAEVIFSPPKKLTKDHLTKIFQQILARLEPIINLPQKALAKTISIKERIERIRNLIFEKAVFNFDELLAGGASKLDVIINFLALLELIKQREIVALQDNLFQGIRIKRF